MPEFCDVAVPLPLEGVFTYRIGSNGSEPVVGGRVLVPFRNERLAGVVTRLHDTPPAVQTKMLIDVLDRQPVLEADLLHLGEWMAQYELAPIGQVVRGMLKQEPAAQESITKATPQQKKIIETLQQHSGRMPLEDLWPAGGSRSALQTLVRRGAVEISEEPMVFQVSGLKAKSSLDFELNAE